MHAADQSPSQSTVRSSARRKALTCADKPVTTDNRASCELAPTLPTPRPAAGGTARTHPLRHVAKSARLGLLGGGGMRRPAPGTVRRRPERAAAVTWPAGPGRAGPPRDPAGGYGMDTGKASTPITDRPHQEHRRRMVPPHPPRCGHNVVPLQPCGGTTFQPHSGIQSESRNVEIASE